MNESITKATQSAWRVCVALEESAKRLRNVPHGSLVTTEERMMLQFIAESLQAARELHSRLAMVAGE